MAGIDYQELKRNAGFDDQDAANLRALGPHADTLIPPTLGRLLGEVRRYPGAQSTLTDGPEPLARLRTELGGWLRTLFGGSYEGDYWELRRRVGQTHDRLGVPQQYVFTAMQVVWDELERGIRGLGLSDADAPLASLHKLLMLELAVIFESYQDSHSEQIRQVEREAVQERLTEAEHLAQIGQLAASLAHEIKNPLAGISGAIQVIRDSTNADAAHRPILDEILRQINRLDGTVKDLLVYARPKPPRFRKCSIEQVVARTLTGLREEPELQRVQLEYVNSSSLPPIEADENQVEQLLTNLLLNAAQASPDGGPVRLTTTALPEGVRLTVADRGNGMDAEVCRRAMEPFFTTKAKGTGLGLPICRKIAQTHGGKIAIQSVAGEGTEVVVDLPRQQAAS